MGISMGREGLEMGDERPVWVSGPKQRANTQYRCLMGNTAGMNGLESRKGAPSLNFDPPSPNLEGSGHAAMWDLIFIR